MDKNFLRILYLVVGVGVASVLIVYLIHRLVMPIHIPLSDANLTIVLSFIGVLATFIVIGNFAQVSDIKRQIEQDLDQKKKEIEKFNNNIEGFRRELNEQKINLDNTEAKHAEFESWTAQQLSNAVQTIKNQSEADVVFSKAEVAKALGILDDYIYRIFSHAITLYGDKDDVLFLLAKLEAISDEEEFKVKIKKGRTTKNVLASAKISKDEIVFYEGEKPIDSAFIVSIDGIKIKMQSLLTLLELYKDILNPPTHKEYSSSDSMSSDDGDESDNIGDSGFKMK